MMHSHEYDVYPTDEYDHVLILVVMDDALAQTSTGGDRVDVELS